MSEHATHPTRPTMWCKKCGYALDGLSENRCPECDREFDPVRRRTFRRKPPVSRRRKIILRSGSAVFLLLLAQPPILYWGPMMEWRAAERDAGPEFQKWLKELRASVPLQVPVPGKPLHSISKRFANRLRNGEKRRPTSRRPSHRIHKSSKGELCQFLNPTVL
jgi:hypothetical protein